MASFNCEAKVGHCSIDPHSYTKYFTKQRNIISYLLKIIRNNLFSQVAVVLVIKINIGIL